MRRISVVVAARYPVVLYGLVTMLRGESDFSIVATCWDGVSCIETVRGLAPDLALVDISLNDQTTSQLLAAIKLEQLRTRVVLFPASSDAPDTEGGITDGIYGVIPKDATPNLLVRFLRQAASVLNSPANPELDGHDYAAENAVEDSSASLTDRERQIMHSVCEGRSNKDIGRQLRLSEGTVKVHLHHIYQKLAIHNRTALAVLAARFIEHPLERAAERTQRPPKV